MAGFHDLLLISGLLGLIFMVLSGDVSRRRFFTRIMIGDGDGAAGTAQMRNAVRAQANFAEYVPLILLLLAGACYAGAPARWVVWPGIVLVAARIAHGVGMHLRVPNPLRAGGAILTWAVLILASLEASIFAFR
jgi:uncharacterized membrane protein YecN with MAPEG domain